MASALTRYRVMAYLTGVFLLLLTAHVIAQYAQSRAVEVAYRDAPGAGAWVPGGEVWIPVAHGYLYLIYVIVAVELWFRTRLDPVRMVAVVFAGTVPFMSFVAERWVSARVRPLLAEGARDRGLGPVPDQVPGPG
jgi:integral membrane protein